MKNIRWTILAALILAAPTVAHAQVQAPPAGAPGVTGSTTTTTTTTSAPDSGVIDTSAPTITSSTGIEPGSMSVTDATSSTTTSKTTALANTGGEPLVISMLGLSMAAGAFFLRRRVTG